MPERRSDYTNRELDHIFKDIAETLGRIEIQTIKTNGTVADINIWREQVRGGAKVGLSLVVLVIVPLFAWALLQVSNIDRKVREGIAQSLAEPYSIEHVND